MDWKPILNRPQSIDTVEFGEKSQKELNQTLKDVFGAKPPKRHPNSRGATLRTHTGLNRYLDSSNASKDYAEDKHENHKIQPKTDTNTDKSEESTGVYRSPLSNNVSHVSHVSQPKKETEELPPWVGENRGWTHEEVEAFKEAVASRSKLP